MGIVKTAFIAVLTACALLSAPTSAADSGVCEYGAAERTAEYSEAASFAYCAENNEQTAAIEETVAEETDANDKNESTATESAAASENAAISNNTAASDDSTAEASGGNVMEAFIVYGIAIGALLVIIGINALLSVIRKRRR